MSNAYYDARIKCGVRSLRYDFERRAGKLHLHVGSRAPPTAGIIEIFKAIDARVETIEVMVGGKLASLVAVAVADAYERRR